MNVYAKQKQTHRYRKQTSGYQRVILSPNLGLLICKDGNNNAFLTEVLRGSSEVRLSKDLERVLTSYKL